jgi:DNA-binding response OmpR family regulator
MMNNDIPIRVLLVDDEQMSADMLAGMFADSPGVTVRHVGDPAQALAAAQEFGPSVMLVDLRMPGADGLDVIRTLRSDPVTARIPLLMLSSEIDPHIKAAGFAAGAADYLVKWPDRVELTARVRAHASAYHVARELALTQAALHDAQKMEAVGKLAGSVAHDVNNILHIINGHLQLMRIEHADERSLRRIDAATEGVRRGTQLTTQLLATARGKP